MIRTRNSGPRVQERQNPAPSQTLTIAALALAGVAAVLSLVAIVRKPPAPVVRRSPNRQVEALNARVDALSTKLTQATNQASQTEKVLPTLAGRMDGVEMQAERLRRKMEQPKPKEPTIDVNRIDKMGSDLHKLAIQLEQLRSEVRDLRSDLAKAERARPPAPAPENRPAPSPGRSPAPAPAPKPGGGGGSGDLAKYEGTYTEDQFGASLEIKEENGQLVASIAQPMNRTFPLKSDGADTFSASENGRSVTLKFKMANGKAESVDVSAMGQNFTFRRQ